MAIVQISRIQHRKGLLTDLPQLASAELGWAVDEQRLFIGNGSLAEGAPFLGNTEILTEYSDLIGSASGYVFKGNSTEQEADTKSDGTDVERTLQDRLDDYVSARAFGFDGTDADCHATFTWALKELYGRGFDSQTRIGLYVPAGTYKVTDSVKVPPFAYIKGDGKGRTVIYSSTALKAVFKTVDTAGNGDSAMGTDLYPGDGEVLPQHIIIEGVTIEQRTGDDLLALLSTTDITFINCEFKGTFNNLSSSSTQAAVSIESTVGAVSGRAKFHLCTFTQLGYAVDQAEELQGGMQFNQCDFITLYKGIVSGDAGDGHSDPIIVSNSVFNGIGQQALVAEDGAKIISIGNQYINCGNGGSGSSQHSILKFNSNGCVSWADQFERPATDAIARIELVGGSTEYAYMDPSDKFSWGHRDTHKTSVQTLGDNDSGSLSDVRLDLDFNKHAEIMYTLVRGGTVQSGSLQVAVISGTASISDNYTYTGVSDAGVIFSLTEAGGFVTVDWQTSSTGDDAEITLSPVMIREL